MKKQFNTFGEFMANESPVFKWDKKLQMLKLDVRVTVSSDVYDFPAIIKFEFIFDEHPNDMHTSAKLVYTNEEDYIKAASETGLSDVNAYFTDSLEEDYEKNVDIITTRIHQIIKSFNDEYVNAQGDIDNDTLMIIIEQGFPVIGSLK